MTVVITRKDAATKEADLTSRIAPTTIRVPGKDLLALRAALQATLRYHLHRDHSMAAIRLEETGRSPLTSELLAASKRFERILDEALVEAGSGPDGEAVTPPTAENPEDSKRS